MKKKTVFICSNCSYESIGYMVKCPECNTWNSFLETVQVYRIVSKNSSNTF